FHDAGAAYPGSGVALAGDLDGDGDVDVVLVEANKLLLGDGTGTFREAGTDPHVPEGSPGDVDGDGDIDVLSGDLFRNDGHGNLSDDPSAMDPALPSLPGDPLGDLDGDGDLDAFAHGHLGRNDGHGVFTDAGCFAAVGDVRDEVLGDLDGDGDLDVYLAET